MAPHAGQGNGAATWTPPLDPAAGPHLNLGKVSSQLRAPLWPCSALAQPHTRSFMDAACTGVTRDQGAAELSADEGSSGVLTCADPLGTDCPCTVPRECAAAAALYELAESHRGV